jgi:hypothetical protein
MCCTTKVADGPALRPGRSAPHDQINPGDCFYLVHGYPSNHMGFVSYRLETSPNLPYIYEGIRPIENFQTHFNRTNYFIYHFFIIHALEVNVA